MSGQIIGKLAQQGEVWVFSIPSTQAIIPSVLVLCKLTQQLRCTTRRPFLPLTSPVLAMLNICLTSLRVTLDQHEYHLLPFQPLPAWPQCPSPLLERLDFGVSPNTTELPSLSTHHILALQVLIPSLNTVAQAQLSTGRAAFEAMDEPGNAVSRLRQANEWLKEVAKLLIFFFWFKSTTCTYHIHTIKFISLVHSVFL